MAQNLEIVINAQDKTNSAFDSANRGLSGFSNKLEDLKPQFQAMATYGTVAFGAISAIAIKSITDYGDAEKSAKQLAYAVLNVSHATKEQLKQTEDLADALERKGVLDGDNIKMGMAQLSTFGLSNDAVRGLGGSLADLAVNQFGVNASGEQLADTANMMAKALNGQFGVLEKSGIRFTEAQQAIIKTGTEMEKVKAINEGFAQNLKYTNEVALTTFEGQLAKVKVQLGNVSEGIGQALLPAVQNLLTRITPVIDSMLQWANANPDLIQKIVIMGGAIAGLVGVVGLLGLALPAIISAFTILTGPVGLVIALIALLVINFDTVKQAVLNLYATLENWGIIAIFRDIWQNIYKNFTNNLIPAFKEFWEALKPLFPYLELFGKFLGAIFIVTLVALAKIVEAMIIVFTDLLTIALKVGTYIASALKPAFDAIASSIDYVYNKVNALISSLSSLWSSMSRFGGNMMSSVGNMFGGSSTKVNDAIITPNGRVITPAEDDFIMATKNPNMLGGGSTPSVSVNISGGSFLSETAAYELGDIIINRLRMELKM